MSVQSASAAHRSFPIPHLLLALAMVAVWGTNFVVIKVALDVLPPLLLATLRFTFVLFPAVFFFKRPPVSWGNLAGYGILIGVGQFGLLYIAMNGRISPGLASLIVQTQVVFTIGLSIALHGERVRGYQWIAVLLAGAGIAEIAVRAGGAATPLGLALVIGAAASWAGGNLVARRNGTVDMLAYVVWASVFSVPPLLLLSLVVDGPHTILRGLRDADARTWAAVLWQSIGNTMFGYAAWGWLLARHPAATVTPMALLVPVFGIGASVLLLNEPLPGCKLLGAALVLGGLALNVFWPMIRTRSPGSTLR